MTAALSAGSALGPAMGGWVFDLTGSYDLAFALGVLFTILAVGCIWLAAPRHGSLVREGAVARTG
jgi:hypothetical protein